MLFGLDGVEIGLIIVFLCLFGSILSGFPVAFAIGGSAIISFGIIAALDSAGLLIHQAIDKDSAMGITLERSKIANDLLTTMARVFGPLPGGLAVSVVVVGAFLAASTGIVGATVVTMGLLSLPTMLRNNYSPELATGVIAASGTLGQIIPPSIVIVLLGTLAGDLYSAAQEARAIEAGCTDALTYLGKPAVVSVGTLFQAALLPGILLALLYAGYAFLYAVVNPSKAPAVELGSANSEPIAKSEALTWFLFAPVGLLVGLILAMQVNVIGSQNFVVDSFTDAGQGRSRRADRHGHRDWGVPDLYDAGDCAGRGALGQHAAADCGDRGRAAGLAGRHLVRRPAHNAGHHIGVHGTAAGDDPIRREGGCDPAGPQRPDPRGLPAAGADRGGAGFDLGRYHQPNS